MEQQIIIVSIFIIGFLLRLIFSLSDTTDEDVSWWLIERQSNKKWINYTLNDSIIEAEYGYPILPHFLISKIPEKYRITAGRFFNILPDFVVAVALLFLAKYIYPNSFFATIVISSLYLIHPVLLPITSRMKTVKGRSLGSMLVFFYFLFYYMAQTHPFLWIFVTISAILIVQSSMFAFQTLFLFSFIFSILTLNPAPTIILIIIWTIGYFIPILKIKEPLNFYFHHKIWYLRNYKQGTTAAKRQNLKNLILLPYYLFTNQRKFGALLFSDLPIAIFFLFLPEAVYILFKYPINPPFSILFLIFSWQIFISSVIVFILINFRPLSFLGQAERYMEYSLPFLVLLMPHILTQTSKPNLYFAALALFHLIIILSIFVVSNIDKLSSSKRSKNEEYNQLIDFLKQKDELKILSIPTKLSFSLSYDLKNSYHKFYYRFAQYKKDKGFRIYENDTNGLVFQNGNYEKSFLVFSITPQKLKEKYSADFLIIEKPYLKGLQEQWGHFTSKYPISFENNKFLVINL